VRDDAIAVSSTSAVRGVVIRYVFTVVVPGSEVRKTSNGSSRSCAASM